MEVEDVAVADEVADDRVLVLCKVISISVMQIAKMRMKIVKKAVLSGTGLKLSSLVFVRFSGLYVERLPVQPLFTGFALLVQRD